MKMNNDGLSATHEEVRRSERSTKFALAGMLVVLAVANGYLFWRVHQLDTRTSEWQTTASQQISEMRENASVADVTHAKNLAALQAELAEARQEASETAGHAKVEALKHADQLARRLADAQQQQQKQVASELNEVKESATTANSKLADVSNDVAATKTDVASTKSALDNTVADLKRVRGDMGVLSDRIATNGTELAALRTLGERNYIEFNLTKSKTPQKVGGIELLVKKTDPKRSRFTIEIQADDRTVEKRDRTLNEPVQFYVAKAHQPYEIVVNEITKDHLVGYLATPKVEVARR
jgi:chromosome segregation ATPase